MDEKNNFEEIISAQLLKAVKDDNVEEVRRLLFENGVDLTVADKDGHTPLSLAAWRGNRKIAELLLAKGADINAKNRWSQTPLSLAVRNGLETSFSNPQIGVDVCDIKLRFIKFLIDKGADVNGSDDSGITPLMYAACDYDIKIAKLLIDNGADVNAADVNGRTVLRLAIAWRRVELIKLLLESGVQVEERDIELARERRDQEIIALLRGKSCLRNFS